MSFRYPTHRLQPSFTHTSTYTSISQWINHVRPAPFSASLSWCPRRLSTVTAAVAPTQSINTRTWNPRPRRLSSSSNDKALPIESPWKNDGLTFSHFISQPSSSVSPAEKLESASATNTTVNAVGSRSTPYDSDAPVAADLGDEFYDPSSADTPLPFEGENHPLHTNTNSLKSQFQFSDHADDGTHTTLKFHIKTYGCQMNVNDADIVRSILLQHHAKTSPTAPKLRFLETTQEIHADILLTNTCAVRDNAERKVWHRLRELRSLDKSHRNARPRIIGVLGCMAERLKEETFREGTADLVVGPDAYRDLPRLISVVKGYAGVPPERASNVRLSLDETYASIVPVRADPKDVSAFVSIMRGCNNMCSYCVVPFTRGRERSREMESVVEETRRLVEEEGVKEVILLGQNVNSYHDYGRDGRRRKQVPAESPSMETNTYQTSNPGFSNLFRLRDGDGHRFIDLLAAVSSLSPELRVRFTSPHPKDYPPPLLTLMAERPNVCSHLHMPAQSGSTSVLERMRRGYTRDAYFELINDVRGVIPDVAISSDFIAGFCGETEEEHRDTLSLMEQVQFDQAFMFAYSMRERTHAHHTMEDNVDPEVKKRRLNEIISVFRTEVQKRNDEVEVGKLRLVLVEGEAKRSSPENKVWSGRTDQNKRVVFPDTGLGAGESLFWKEDEVRQWIARALTLGSISDNPDLFDDAAVAHGAEEILRTKVGLSRGDYAVVHITEARGHTLKGRALWRSSIVSFDELMRMRGEDGASASDFCKSLLNKQILTL